MNTIVEMQNNEQILEEQKVIVELEYGGIPQRDIKKH